MDEYQKNNLKSSKLAQGPNASFDKYINGTHCGLSCL